MSSDEGWIDVVDAARRQHCSVKTIRAHVKKGSIRSMLQRVPGRAGRMVRKRMVWICDLDAALPVIDVQSHIEELVRKAPPLSERRRARIWLIMKNSSQSGSPG